MVLKINSLVQRYIAIIRIFLQLEIGFEFAGFSKIFNFARFQFHDTVQEGRSIQRSINIDISRFFLSGLPGFEKSLLIV
jgi:hypothetical protein